MCSLQKCQRFAIIRTLCSYNTELLLLKERIRPQGVQTVHIIKLIQTKKQSLKSSARPCFLHCVQIMIV